MNFFTQKNFLTIAGMILALFAGIAIGGGFKQSNTARIGNFAVNTTQEAVSKNKNGDGGNLVNTVGDGTLAKTSMISNDVKVIRVIDGDTIEIEGGERVRYIGIDTPETVDPKKSIQCFGVEAYNKNKELILGKTARLEKDITERDKYGRLPRYVWLDDVFVNLELVKQGFAYSYSYPPDIKYQDLFVKAQQEAREAKRGLWNSCPTIISTGTQVPVSRENNSNDSCVIKGNIGASGEKIYHLPGCGSYEKTKIDGTRGERWFCTESEALTAGWRKALNCQ